MSFSGNCRVAIICAAVFLFPHVQGHQKNKTSDRFLLNGGIYPSCCVETSPAYIRAAVIACYEQRPNTFRNCKVHAYIFVTDSKENYCVDPSASWVPKRLDILAAKGVNCTVL